MLLHTLSHALIREFALDCGYASSSIRERIYSRSGADPMAGILLYTAAPDSEGTLGGLVSLGAPERLADLLNNALDNTRVCTSDPTCAEHLAGELRDEHLHGAACHACLFASETSCEQEIATSTAVCSSRRLLGQSLHSSADSTATSKSQTVHRMIPARRANPCPAHAYVGQGAVNVTIAVGNDKDNRIVLKPLKRCTVSTTTPFSPGATSLVSPTFWPRSASTNCLSGESTVTCVGRMSPSESNLATVSPTFLLPVLVMQVQRIVVQDRRYRDKARRARTPC